MCDLGAVPPANQALGSNKADARDYREYLILNGGVLNKTLRIYPDCIRVGCTYVSEDALEFIIKKWNGRRKEEDGDERGENS